MKTESAKLPIMKTLLDKEREFKNSKYIRAFRRMDQTAEVVSTVFVNF